MRRKNKMGLKFQALLLAVSMTMSLSSSAVFAGPEAPAVHTEEAIVETTEDLLAEPEDTDKTEAGSSSELPEDTEEVTADVVPEEEEEEITVTDEFIDEAEHEAEEDSEYEENGEFGLAVTDVNGSKMKCWYDSSTNIYYLFLTNAVSIPDMELQVEGLPMKAVSKGTLDTKTNVVKGAFSASGDGVTLTAKNGKKYNVIVKQSGLPSLSISLNGVDLQTINRGSKTIKYEGNSVILTDASGNINLTQSDVEVKGRGNTTWDSSQKKPYQIKFAKKQSVLGMAKAKKWVLLASAFDDSMLRNKVAFYLGDALGMRYSPDLEFCDLWVDGEYRGTYSIGEKCEVTDKRLNLTAPLGALVEYDNFFYRQEDFWYEDSVIGTHFALADCVDEDQGKAALNAFRGGMEKFENYLYNTPAGSVTVSALSKYIDVEEAAKWYLVNEYLSNVESFSTSWFWYQDGPSDILHMGPLWDFDTSQGIPGNWSGTDFMFGKTHNGIFKRLMASPDFSAYVKNVYKQYRGVFSGLSLLADEWGNSLKTAADGNYTRWKWLGGKNLKGKPFATTYQGAINDLTGWLYTRDQQFGIKVPAVPELSASFNETDRTIHVTVKNAGGYTSLDTAVWSEVNGQDDLKWYSKSVSPDGTVTYSVKASDHKGTGNYQIHVYGRQNGKQNFIGKTSVNVTALPKSEISAVQIEGTGDIQITAKYVTGFSSVRAAVWGVKDGQNDLIWYRMNKQTNGCYAVTVASSSHNEIGTYAIHLYGTNSSGSNNFIGNTSLEVIAPSGPDLSVSTVTEGRYYSAVLKNASSCDSMKFAVWGAVDGQNDIVWYTAKKSGSNWVVDIDIQNHREEGPYYVHAYGMKSGKQIFQDAATFTPENVKFARIDLTISDSGKFAIASLENCANFSSVQMAVWSQNNSQDDLKWVKATRNLDGSWTAEIDVYSHKDTGLYYVHAYGMKDGKQIFSAGNTFTVSAFRGPVVSVIDKEKAFLTKISNVEDYERVRIAVWTQFKEQDDLKWYQAAKYSDGSFRYITDTRKHGGNGTYNIHVYGTKNGKETFLGKGVFIEDSYEAAVLQADLSEDGKTMVITSTDPVGYDKIKVAVWGAKDGQNDLKWYTMTRDASGNYIATVKIADHNETGIYNLHAYGWCRSVQLFMANTTCEVV